MPEGVRLHTKEYPEMGKEIEMEKAYDLTVLVSGLKSAGLDIAEDSAKALVDTVLSWVESSAKVSENKLDDMVVGFMPALRSYIDEKIDKIDGKVG